MAMHSDLAEVFAHLRRGPDPVLDPVSAMRSMVIGSPSPLCNCTFFAASLRTEIGIGGSGSDGDVVADDAADGQ